MHDDHAVDAWVLKAVPSTDEPENAPLRTTDVDLIQKQVEASDAYFKEIIAASAGVYRERRVDMQAKGATTMQIPSFWKRQMKHDERIRRSSSGAAPDCIQRPQSGQLLNQRHCRSLRMMVSSTNQIDRLSCSWVLTACRVPLPDTPLSPFRCPAPGLTMLEQYGPM